MTEMTILIENESKVLKIGDNVDVSDPKHGDSTHCCSFSGVIKEFKSGFIIVEDQDFDCFTIEQDEIEDVY